MKKLNLLAVAFVAVFTQSITANAAKTNVGSSDNYFGTAKSERMSAIAIDAERGGAAIDNAKAMRNVAAIDNAKAMRGIAAIDNAKGGYSPSERGGKCRVEYPQAERGKC